MPSRVVNHLNDTTKSMCGSTWMPVRCLDIWEEGDRRSPSEIINALLFRQLSFLARNEPRLVCNDAKSSAHRCTALAR